MIHTHFQQTHTNNQFNECPSRIPRVYSSRPNNLLEKKSTQPKRRQPHLSPHAPPSNHGSRPCRMRQRRSTLPSGAAAPQCGLSCVISSAMRERESRRRHTDEQSCAYIAKTLIGWFSFHLLINTT